MKKAIGGVSLLMLLLCSLCGCAVGEKSASLSAIYTAAGVMSLLLLLGYLLLIREKNRWMITLFVAVCCQRRILLVSDGAGRFRRGPRGIPSGVAVARK